MTHLKVGDPAPDFEAKDQNGNLVKLSDFKGKKIILYFYPKDLTPGCTAEAINLTENYETLKAKGYEVIGVSTDDEKKHQKFIEKYNIPYMLIADTDKKVVNLYGVWGPKKFMGREYEGIHRTTFVIDENGIIEKIIEKVNTKDHTNQILND
ncbi:MAG: thioredoxin-dependent thiol peroxidase [Bacteroidetes bacterium]|nr:MAG: thioredoxin-dependent thiol peroxidase [Bacteroidota bacterium]